MINSSLLVRTDLFMLTVHTHVCKWRKHGVNTGGRHGLTTAGNMITEVRHKKKKNTVNSDLTSAAQSEIRCRTIYKSCVFKVVWTVWLWMKKKNNNLKKRLHQNVIQRHLFVIGIKNHFGIFSDFRSEYTTLFTSVDCILCKGASPAVTVKAANVRENTVFFSAFLLYFGNRYVYQVPGCNLAQLYYIIFLTTQLKLVLAWNHSTLLCQAPALPALLRCSPTCYAPPRSARCCMGISHYQITKSMSPTNRINQAQVIESRATLTFKSKCFWIVCCSESLTAQKGFSTSLK